MLSTAVEKSISIEFAKVFKNTYRHASVFKLFDGRPVEFFSKRYSPPQEADVWDMVAEISQQCFENTSRVFRIVAETWDGSIQMKDFLIGKEGILAKPRPAVTDLAEISKEQLHELYEKVKAKQKRDDFAAWTELGFVAVVEDKRHHISSKEFWGSFPLRPEQTIKVENKTDKPLKVTTSVAPSQERFSPNVFLPRATDARTFSINTLRSHAVVRRSGDVIVTDLGSEGCVLIVGPGEHEFISDGVRSWRRRLEVVCQDCEGVGQWPGAFEVHVCKTCNGKKKIKEPIDGH